MWITKKKLKKENLELKANIKNTRALLDEETRMNQKMMEFNQDLINQLNMMKDTYPLELGETVYDVQLRSSTGRFTKTKASREHSLVNEVVVDKKNYFNLVTRYNSKDVFKSREEANQHVIDVCVE